MIGMKREHFYLGNAEKNLLGTKDLENNYDFDDNSYVYDENKKNDSHVAVVKQIKDNSTVLDIGCASGILGSIIAKNKNCIVDGIEYDKESCRVLKKRNIYRDIYNFSITDFQGEEYKKFIKLNRKYDYIVFADVLEHLVDPWQVLVNISSLLNKDGKIIISLPNIAHLDIIKGLINNEFNYTRWGILDKTHIRFFTPSSLKDMIDNIADEYKVYFSLNKCEDILIKPEYFVDFEKYRLFNVNSNLESYLALQNVYTLTLENSKKNMKNNIKNENIDNFDKMLESFNALYETNEKNNNDIEKIRKEVERLENELTAIKNSKRWKTLNKFMKIFGK